MNNLQQVNAVALEQAIKLVGEHYGIDSLFDSIIKLYRALDLSYAQGLQVGYKAATGPSEGAVQQGEPPVVVDEDVMKAAVALDETLPKAHVAPLVD